MHDLANRGMQAGASASAFKRWYCLAACDQAVHLVAHDPQVELSRRLRKKSSTLADTRRTSGIEHIRFAVSCRKRFVAFSTLLAALGGFLFGNDAGKRRVLCPRRGER